MSQQGIGEYQKYRGKFSDLMKERTKKKKKKKKKKYYLRLYIYIKKINGKVNKLHADNGFQLIFRLHFSKKTSSE